MKEIKDLNKDELKRKIMSNLHYNDSRSCPRYDDIDFYSINPHCEDVIQELIEEKKISINEDIYIIPFVDPNIFKKIN